MFRIDSAYDTVHGGSIIGQTEKQGQAVLTTSFIQQVAMAGLISAAENECPNSGIRAIHFNRDIGENHVDRNSVKHPTRIQAFYIYNPWSGAQIQADTTWLLQVITKRCKRAAENDS